MIDLSSARVSFVDAITLKDLGFNESDVRAFAHSVCFANPELSKAISDFDYLSRVALLLAIVAVNFSGIVRESMGYSVAITGYETSPIMHHQIYVGNILVFEICDGSMNSQYLYSISALNPMIFSGEYIDCVEAILDVCCEHGEGTLEFTESISAWSIEDDDVSPEDEDIPFR